MTDPAHRELEGKDRAAEAGGRREAAAGAPAETEAGTGSEALTHVGSGGEARMVDVSAKPATARMARARGSIAMSRAAFDAVRQSQVAKGDVLSVARIAGILAAKRTADLVPLCHQIPLSDVEMAFTADSALPGYQVEAVARTTAGTGVEMEAIVAVSLALITIYDMTKGIDRGMRIGEIELVEKSGGRTGHWKRP